jgi:hypothetical protein
VNTISWELIFLEIIVFWLDLGGNFDLEAVFVVVVLYLGFHPL